MFWTGFFVGFAACLTIWLTRRLLHERRQRAAFVAGLSPAERAMLEGYETFKDGGWQNFRDLLRR
jgi:hypothetical protein